MEAKDSGIQSHNKFKDTPEQQKKKGKRKVRIAWRRGNKVKSGSYRKCFFGNRQDSSKLDYGDCRTTL